MLDFKFDVLALKGLRFIPLFVFSAEGLQLGKSLEKGLEFPCQDLEEVKDVLGAI